MRLEKERKPGRHVYWDYVRGGVLRYCYTRHLSDQDGTGLMRVWFAITESAQISPMCEYPAAFLNYLLAKFSPGHRLDSRVQRIRQLARRNNALIHKHNAKPLIRPGLHHRRQRIIIRHEPVLAPRVRRRDDLGHENGRIGQLRQDIVDDIAQTRGGLREGLGGGFLAIKVVGREVNEDDVGIEGDSGPEHGAYLVDGPAGVALVLVVLHGARGLGADEVDGCACRGEAREELLAIAVGTLAVHVAPGDGVAEGEDAEGCREGGGCVVGGGYWGADGDGGDYCGSVWRRVRSSSGFFVYIRRESSAAGSDSLEKTFNMLALLEAVDTGRGRMNRMGNVRLFK